MSNKALNRLKFLLAENQKIGKWFAGQIGKSEATISSWCTNCSQPFIETLFEIAKVLQVDEKELLPSATDDSQMLYIKLPNNGLNCY